MYSQQPGANTAAHDYSSAQYQPQSTDERVWDDGLNKHPVPTKRPNYKPTPLRWPYIASLIIFLMAIMGLVVWARIAMPHSDSTAHVEGKREEMPVAQPTVVPVKVPEVAVPEKVELEIRADDTGVMNADALATTVIVSQVSSTVTVGGTTGKFTTMVPSTIFTTKFAEPSTITHAPSTITSWAQFTLTSAIVTNVIKTMPGSSSVVIETGWSTGFSVGEPTGTEAPFSNPFSVPFLITKTITFPGSVATEQSTLTTKIVSSSSYASVLPGSTEEIAFSSEITEAVGTTAVLSVGTTTKAASTFITLGQVTITSVYTDPDYTPDKPTVKPTTKVVNVVTVEPDKTDKKVEKLAPVTYVSTAGGVETVVVNPGVKTVVTEVDGQSQTVVVTQAAVETVVSDVEGYVTTMDITTWGDDGLLTTSKVVSSVSGFRTTIVSSVQPTTFVTTRAESIMTITSSRSGSTTIVSTKKGQTKTYSSTATITPTAAESEPTGGVRTDTQVIKITEAQYFIGKFLPPFLAVLLSIPARIIDFNAQLYQPFYALNLPNGALGPNSMNLHFGGWNSIARPFTLLFEGQPVTFFTMVIVWLTAIMTPVATEAIGVKIHGNCKTWDPRGCAAALGVSPDPTRILLALLALTIVLLCLLLLFLRNWETGLHANPWSVVGIASLATNREVRPQKSTERKISKEMADKRFGFGYFENDHGHTEYGIVLYDDAGQRLQQHGMGSLSEASSLDMAGANRNKRRGNPFMALGIAWRLAFLVFLLGLMALVIFYTVTFKKQNNFQNFMTGQTFGIRFLFAALGVIISFCWTTLFISVAMIMPYKAMAASPQSPTDSILLTRPTNPFSGFWSSVQRRQFFLAIIALMTIFSEFMPILLANIPYTLTQTQDTHVVCLRLSVAIMGTMVLAIAASFFIKWPYVPVDPRSIAGAMYYVSESAMLDQYSGMASLDNHERRRRVQELGGRYWYGDIVTHTGETRPAVDRDDGMLHSHDARSAAQPPMVQNFNTNVDTAYHGHQHGVDNLNETPHYGQARGTPNATPPGTYAQAQGTLNNAAPATFVQVQGTFDTTALATHVQGEGTLDTTSSSYYGQGQGTMDTTGTYAQGHGTFDTTYSAYGQGQGTLDTMASATSSSYYDPPPEVLNNNPAYYGQHQENHGATAAATYQDYQNNPVSPIAEPTYNGQYHGVPVADADITTAHYEQQHQMSPTNAGTGYYDHGYQYGMAGTGANTAYYGQQYDPAGANNNTTYHGYQQ